METFVPSKVVFEKLFTQTGGSIDRYIFGQQGQGLGNWFAKIFRHVRPLLGRAINTIQPELSSIGGKLIDSASNAAIEQIGKARQKATEKIKRKRDNLDV